jgi:diguanylate cyclase (GGDEF)-like protein/PAS domain S-box-containing protein
MDYQPANQPANKAIALMAILRRLDLGENLSSEALARELGVTRRTVFRYIDSLQAAGYPIYFDRNRMSYRFVDTYQLRHSSTEKRLTRTLELNQQMMAASSIGIAVYRLFDGRCVLANESLARMLNATREQLLAQDFRLIPSWRESGLFAMVEEAISLDEERSGDFHILTTFGRELWTHCVLTPFTNDGQRHFFLMAQDISARKHQELAMATLLAAIDKGPSLTVITDCSGVIGYVSSKIKEVTGYEPDELIGDTLHIFKPDILTPAAGEELLDTVRNGREWIGELLNRRKDSSAYWEQIRISPVVADDTITNYVAVIEDITQRKQREEELYQQATIDSLTGLYNRRMIFELGKHEIAVACRHHLPLALLMVDIDRFKQINDTYGHAAGDEVLRMVADACRTSLRTCDPLGRIGGDEFVVVFTEASAHEARQAAGRLRAKVAAMRLPWQESEISLSVSIGVAMLQQPETRFEDLLATADKALYAAKEAGRNRVTVSG